VHTQLSSERASTPKHWRKSCFAAKMGVQNPDSEGLSLSSASTASVVKRPEPPVGLAYWMQRVLEECDRASADFAPDPVHDLRVALRRCRSMADGLIPMDPDRAWRDMKKSGKKLFSSLGELRDVQVMEEWVRRLAEADDPTALAILGYLGNREMQLKGQAAQALKEFDRKQWARWTRSLPRRAAKFRQGSAIFKHLALEKWTAAHDLHRRALRNRSQVAFHSLRIGLKRFRYIVENFLPQQHLEWKDDLKELQDQLGEVHDLDVLWATAVRIHAFPDPEARSRWHGRILEERGQRIAKYHEKMVGKSALWNVWRAELPQGEEISAAALSRLRLWGSILDPDFKHADHISHLALQLYDGLPGKNSTTDNNQQDERAALRLAALLHDVGRSKREKGHHKTTFRLVSNMTPPLSWTGRDLHLVGSVARYHRGALPHAGQKSLTGLTPAERKTVLRLAAILRLADAFDFMRDGRITGLEVREQEGIILIAAKGYSPRDRMAEQVAAARHLLELVYRRPVMVKAMTVPSLRLVR
jgi:exopolyphosphatase/guanosine-5'-triphosphate,3'-diphosphate pyrophosphatase